MGVVATARPIDREVERAWLSDGPRRLKVRTHDGEDVSGRAASRRQHPRSLLGNVRHVAV